MTITRHKPNRAKEDVKPQAFPEGSRAAFDATMAQIRSTYQGCKKYVVEKWEAWDKNHIPITDDADEYIKT